MLTQEQVRKSFDYCALSGNLVRKKTGKLGSINGTGYHQFLVDGKIYGAHRLIWLYVFGEFPKNDIDHINGIRDDNRIANLRNATRSQNLQNTHKCRSDNKSGFLGVHYSNSRKKFIAKIELLGKTKQIGSFNSAAEAATAYLNAKRELHEFCTI